MFKNSALLIAISRAALMILHPSRPAVDVSRRYALAADVPLPLHPRLAQPLRHR
jgi:hypothetical protein